MKLCEILEIPRSSYYKYRNTKKSQKEIQDEQLCQLITEYDTSYDHILGYRRMRMFINRLNQKNYSINYIRRLMRYLGIKSKIRRTRPGYIKSNAETTAENKLNREFEVSKPNEKWLTDVTEFKVIGQNQKVYLSAILDLYDKSIVAYEIGLRNDNQLVFKTFDNAIGLNPTATPLFHSDRGFQYTSKIFQFKLHEQGMIQSMSRVGRCIDNGPMEAFWGILKSEMYYLNKFYSLENLKEMIKKYIDFYNNNRFQEKLKCLSPIEYRNQALKIA